MKDGQAEQPVVASVLTFLGWVNIGAAAIGVFALGRLYSRSYGYNVTTADIVWIASVGIAGLTSGALLVGAAEGLRLLARLNNTIARSPAAPAPTSWNARPAPTSLDSTGPNYEISDAAPITDIQQAKRFLIAKGFDVSVQEDATLTFSAGVSRGMDFSRGFGSERAFVAFAEEVRRGDR